MFRSIFNPENDFWVVVGWITDVLFLSIFWLLGCAPVVTIGASTAALYDAAYRIFRRKEKRGWIRFWQTYIRNLKSSILPNILYLALLLGVGSVLINLWNSAVAGGSWLLFAAAAVIGLVVFGALCLVFPVLSRFESGALQLLGNSFRLAMANLPRTVAIAVICGAAGWLCLRFILPLVIAPALAAVLVSFFIEPILKPYLPEDFYE